MKSKMKLTTHRLFVLIMLVCFSHALAQSPPPADSSLPVIGGTPLPLTSATVSAIVPDKMLAIQTGAGSPVQYRIAKQPVYAGLAGGAVDPSTIKPGMKVLVHFMEDGNETIIDRIFVQ